jgi:hypothetical protein
LYFEGKLNQGDIILSSFSTHTTQVVGVCVVVPSRSMMVSLTWRQWTRAAVGAAPRRRTIVTTTSRRRGSTHCCRRCRTRWYGSNSPTAAGAAGLQQRLTVLPSGFGVRAFLFFFPFFLAGAACCTKRGHSRSRRTIHSSAAV